MTAGLLLGFGIGALLVLAGVVLGVLSLWWRCGRSPAARWWVREVPLAHQRGYAFTEGLALVQAPVFAQTSAALGVLVAIAPLLAPLEGVVLVLFAVLALIQFAILLAGRMLTINRRILPLWIYPSWLRPTRRAEAEVMRRGGR